MREEYGCLWVTHRNVSPTFTLGRGEQEDKTLSMTGAFRTALRTLQVISSRCNWTVLLSTSKVAVLSCAEACCSSRVNTNEGPVIASYIYPHGAPYATSGSQASLLIPRRPINHVFPLKYTSLETISRSTQLNMLRQLLKVASS
ncbi:hypothetical protein ARMSODRAFT_439225 [Armillaria solidipes]|uniref:Uncharacterized protein n=1 Tax=Armillaria solidipes TaxID=1076256 RepID=A0A2H3BGS9_9AGAR|nr:hypothetical protein ARMSODRAFT_439225 [Armillaria solidipes]